MDQADYGEEIGGWYGLGYQAKSASIEERSHIEKNDSSTCVLDDDDGRAREASYDVTANSELRNTGCVQNDLVAQGKARALAALSRIQQQATPAVPEKSHDTGVLHVVADGFVAEKRKRAFEQETTRKRAALQRNLEYLASKETRRIALLDQQAEQAAAQERTARMQLQQQLRERQDRLLGVSPCPMTVHQHTKSAKQQDTTAALYLSGLEHNPSDCDEAAIRALFGVFGTIRKVHFYANKKTGELKGDGLVVFHVPDAAAADRVLQSVCGQLNGAELAGGSILHVEPSRNQKTSKSKGRSRLPLPETNRTAEAPDAPVDETEELDAFFESLR